MSKSAVVPVNDATVRPVEHGNRGALRRSAHASSDFSFAKDNYICSEKDGFVEIEILRNGGATAEDTMSVNITSEDGSALAGKHYNSIKSMAVFQPGEEKTVVKVALFNSPSYDPQVTFTVRLTNNKGLVYQVATVNILDDVSKLSLICRTVDGSPPYVVITVMAMVFTIVIPQIQTLYINKDSDDVLQIGYTISLVIFLLDEALQVYIRKWLYMPSSQQLMDLIAILGCLMLCDWFIELFIPEDMDPVEFYYRRLLIDDLGHIARVMKLGALIGRFSGILIAVVNFALVYVKKIMGHVRPEAPPGGEEGAAGEGAEGLAAAAENGTAAAVAPMMANGDVEAPHHRSSSPAPPGGGFKKPSAAVVAADAAAGRGAAGAGDEGGMGGNKGTNKMVISVVEGLVSRLVLVITVILFLYVGVAKPARNRVAAQGLVSLTLTWYWDPASVTGDLSGSSAFIALKSLYAVPPDYAVPSVDPKINLANWATFLNWTADDLAVDDSPLKHLVVGGANQTEYTRPHDIDALRMNGEFIYAGLVIGDVPGPVSGEEQSRDLEDWPSYYCWALNEVRLEAIKSSPEMEREMAYPHFDESAALTLSGRGKPVPACPVLSECRLNTRKGLAWSVSNLCDVSSAVFDNRPLMRQMARARLGLAAGMVCAVLIGVICITLDLLHQVLNPLLRLANAAKKMKSHLDLLKTTIQYVADGDVDGDDDYVPPEDAVMSSSQPAPAMSTVGDGKLDASEARHLVRAMLGKGEEGDTLAERVDGLHGLFNECAAEPIALMVQALYDVQTTLGVSVDNLARMILEFQSEVDARWPALRSLASQVDDKSLTREIFQESAHFLAPPVPDRLSAAIDSDPRTAAARAVARLAFMATAAAADRSCSKVESRVCQDLGYAGGHNVSLADMERWVLGKARPTIRAALTMTHVEVPSSFDEMSLDQIQRVIVKAAKEVLVRVLTPLGVDVTEVVKARAPRRLLRTVESALVQAVLGQAHARGVPIPGECRDAASLKEVKKIVEPAVCDKVARLAKERADLDLPPNVREISHIKWGLVVAVCDRMARIDVEEIHVNGVPVSQPPPREAVSLIQIVVAEIGRVVQSKQAWGAEVLSHPSVQMSVLRGVEDALRSFVRGPGSEALERALEKLRALKDKAVEASKSPGAALSGGLDVGELKDIMTETADAVRAAGHAVRGGPAVARALEVLRTVFEAIQRAAKAAVARIDPAVLHGRLEGVLDAAPSMLGEGASALASLSSALGEAASSTKAAGALGDGGGLGPAALLAGEKVREALRRALEMAASAAPPERQAQAREAVSRLVARLEEGAAAARVAGSGAMATAVAHGVPKLPTMDEVRAMVAEVAEAAGPKAGALVSHIQKLLAALQSSMVRLTDGSGAGHLSPMSLLQSLGDLAPSMAIIPKVQELLAQFPLPAALGGDGRGLPSSLSEAVEALRQLVAQAQQGGGAGLGGAGDKAMEMLLAMLQPLQKVQEMFVEALKAQGMSIAGGAEGMDPAILISQIEEKAMQLVAKLRELVAQLAEQMASNPQAATGFEKAQEMSAKAQDTVARVMP